MAKPIDTDATLEVGWSWLKLALILPGFALLGFLSVLMLRAMGSVAFWTSPIALLVVSLHGLMALLVLCSCLLAVPILLWMVMALPRPIVVLSPQGLLDRRWSPDIIPWSTVERLQMRRFREGWNLTLLLRPDHDLSLRRMALARLFRRSEVWRPGALRIDLLSLSIRPLDLHAAAEAYLGRYGSSSASPYT